MHVAGAIDHQYLANIRVLELKVVQVNVHWDAIVRRRAAGVLNGNRIPLGRQDTGRNDQHGAVLKCHGP
ncbi:MAG TPA: hypothetical protein VJP76_03370 [Candidatus Tumulicola sp.]|nr:hypothetical protein [Candidatus Tumulicola sp.]